MRNSTRLNMKRLFFFDFKHLEFEVFKIKIPIFQRVNSCNFTGIIIIFKPLEFERFKNNRPLIVKNTAPLKLKILSIRTVFKPNESVIFMWISGKNTPFPWKVAQKCSIYWGGVLNFELRVLRFEFNSKPKTLNSKLTSGSSPKPKSTHVSRQNVLKKFPKCSCIQFWWFGIRSANSRLLQTTTKVLF